MKFVFFAARHLHRDYFSKISQQLTSSHADGSVVGQVLWHKKLWQTPAWLTQIGCAFSSTTQHALSSAVEDHIREKQNSQKGRQSTAIYWLFFGVTKHLEAIILFAIYRYALKTCAAQQMVIWNGLKYRQRVAITAAKSLGIGLIYMENGLLPGMTTLDKQGINFCNSVPRTIEAFKQLAPIDLTPLNISLTKQFSERPAHLPKSYIFVPFQVNTDSQIVLFSSWIKDMFDLVKQFEKAATVLGHKMPAVVFKPHPACDQNYDDFISQYEGHDKLYFEQNTPTPVLIQHADAVATINSTVGIESLLLDKKLIVMGQAFYAYPSLSLTVDCQSALQHALAELTRWQPNHQHIQQLFHYLSKHYQLPGKWQDAEQNHIEECARRLLELAA